MGSEMSKHQVSKASPGNTLGAMSDLGLALDHPWRTAILAIHTDGDAETTLAAVGAKQRAQVIADMRQVDLSDATVVQEALLGSAQGGGAQALMKKYIGEARPVEKEASILAADAVSAAVDSLTSARKRLKVPAEMVVEEGVPTATRAQLCLLDAELDQSIAYEKSRGKWHHFNRPPPPAVRHALEVTVAIGEALLITKRIANTTWSSPTTMVLFTVLSVIFFWGVHFITHHVGAAVADHRELVSAARDLTAVATSEEVTP
jgi:hypothetical protein